MSEFFEKADIVFRYTRRMAIADGVLIDATQGEFAAVSRDHFPNYHLAMTSAVFALLESAVKTGDGADFATLPASGTTFSGCRASPSCAAQ
jgi:hypothetical protein